MQTNVQYIQELNRATFRTRGKGLIPLNLSKRKKDGLMLDTEASGTFKDKKFKCYDISIKTQKQDISYILSNIFDNAEEMAKAYYKKKIPFYNKKLEKDSKYQKLDTRDALLQLNDIIKKEKLTFFKAYNSKFDFDLVNDLYDLYGIPNLFKKLYVVDIAKVVADIISTTPELHFDYCGFCASQGYLTDSKISVSLKADTVGKYIYQDLDFKENHTGLEDCNLEQEILEYFLDKYKEYHNKDYYYKLDNFVNYKDDYGNMFRTWYINELYC